MSSEAVNVLLRVIATLALLLTAQLFVMRLFLIARTRRQARCLAVWEPILIDAADTGGVQEAPRLAARDQLTFLTLWNHLQESLIGEGSERLNGLARRIGIPGLAVRMLQRGNLRQRLTAMVTLGHLRERSVWPLLSAHAASRHVALSLAAARALIHIDRAAAAACLIPLILHRTDWPAARAATLLRAMGADLVSEPLARAALHAPAEHAPRLIRYLDVIHANSAIPAVRRIISLSTELEVVTACLRVLRDPEDLETIRGFLDDPRWEVRVQAVAALGRIGTSEDARHLKRRLADSEWWVRYRAAHALCELVAEEELDHIQQTHLNPFARDVLAQARAERQLA